MKSLEYYIKNHKLESFINNSLYNEALYNFFDENIDPKYLDIANDILNNSHYICYHFTNVSNVDSILKNGLRCKSDSSKDAPKRIYLYCDINIIENNHIKENIVKTIYEIFGNDVNLNDICAIKIDMNELKNITVYKDTLMYDNHSVFIYNNIPEKFIKKVIKFKDYN